MCFSRKKLILSDTNLNSCLVCVMAKECIYTFLQNDVNQPNIVQPNRAIKMVIFFIHSYSSTIHTMIRKKKFEYERVKFSQNEMIEI